MTLAVFLLIIIPFVAPPSGAQQPTSTGSAAQDQKPPASTSATPTIQESSPKTHAKPHSSAKKAPKKKPADTNCTDPSSASPATGASSTASPEPGGAANNASPSSTAPRNCPPKIIVQQGGTTETSIQLAGGPSVDAAAQKIGAINQLLATTDQNLKKASERQLTSVQQDTVTQTRQFMEQSKQAMADGDLDRARTLAWKAEVLSEDLVKPEK